MKMVFLNQFFGGKKAANFKNGLDFIFYLNIYPSYQTKIMAAIEKSTLSPL